MRKTTAIIGWLYKRLVLVEIKNVYCKFTVHADLMPK